MNRIVIVTGGSQGIGREIAKKFLMEKDIVMIASRNVETGKQAEKDLCVYGTCQYIKTDVSKEEDCQELIEQVIGNFGRIDVLVNNAGIFCRPELNGLSRILDADISKFKSVLDINVVGQLQLIKYAGRAMADENKGVIISIGSIAGMLGIYDMPEYSIAKAVVSMLNKCAALQLAPYGIRCVNLCPGWVETETNGLIGNSSNTLHMRGNAVTMEQIAETVFFLSSEGAGAINGTDIFADDGYTSFKGEISTNADKFAGFRFRSNLRLLTGNFKEVLIFATVNVNLMKSILNQLCVYSNSFHVFASLAIGSMLEQHVGQDKILKYEMTERMDISFMKADIQNIKSRMKPDCIMIPCIFDKNGDYDNVYEVARMFECDIYWLFTNGTIKKAEKP